VLAKIREQFAVEVERLGGNLAASLHFGCTSQYVWMLRTGRRPQPGHDVGERIDQATDNRINYKTWRLAAKAARKVADSARTA
jgi:hypothetical protein